MNPSSGKFVSAENDSRPVIFLVDDEVMLLDLNALILVPLGFQVRTFSKPENAMRAYLSADPRPTLIVTDYAMGNDTLTGLDVIAACRRVNPNQKILLVSGTVDETIFQDAADKPDCFLAKPYQARQLTEMVSALLGQ